MPGLVCVCVSTGRASFGQQMKAQQQSPCGTASSLLHGVAIWAICPAVGLSVRRLSIGNEGLLLGHATLGLTSLSHIPVPYVEWSGQRRFAVFPLWPPWEIKDRHKTTRRRIITSHRMQYTRPFRRARSASSFCEDVQGTRRPSESTWSLPGGRLLNNTRLFRILGETRPSANGFG